MEAITYAAAILFFAGGIAYWKLFLKHELYLEGLCLGFPVGRYRRLPPNYLNLEGKRSYVFESQYQGRQLRVDYRYRSARMERQRRSFFDREYVLSWILSDELEIQLQVIQKFWLRILQKRIPAPSEDLVLIGVPEFDEVHLVHSNQPEAAREFLGSRMVREQLAQLPKYFERLEIHRGWLKLLIHRPVKAGFLRSDLEDSLAVLSFLALDYVQRGLQFKLAVSGASGSCPYCRAQLEDSTERLVECSVCRTRLHQTCWTENGQCTTWGCLSGVPLGLVSHSGQRIS